MDLISIINNETLETASWNNLILNRSKEHHFLVLLSPLMDDVFRKINSSLVDNNFLKPLVLNWCYTQLSIMIIRVCVLELNAARENNLLKGVDSESRFNHFIEALMDKKNAMMFFEKYTPLKKQIEIAATQFINATQELLARLAEHQHEIKNVFFKEYSHSQLTHIQSAGDRHQGGHSVAILTFTTEKGDIKLVYKPRSLAIDLAFQDLFHWCNKKSPSLDLYTLKILNKDTYGWCEFIDNQSCDNEQQLQNFYRRMGSLLLIFYLMNGSDLHAENIIAHGQYPIIIDYECALRPLILTHKHQSPSVPRSLVTQIGFLPARFLMTEDYQGMDVSAMNAAGGEESIYHDIEWLDIGKDTMRAKRIRKKIKPFANQPVLANVAIDPLDYEENFVKGFVEAYQLVLQHQSELMDKDSPLENFKNSMVRLVIRNTSDYAKLLFESWHPRLVFDNNARSDHFSWLEKTAEKNDLLRQEALDSELADLYQGNIPFFSYDQKTNNILNSSGNILNVVVIKSGSDIVYEQLQNHFHEQDLMLQTHLIKTSFVAARLNKENNNSKGTLIPKRHDKKYNFSELKEIALNITKNELDELLSLCISNHEKVFWPLLKKQGNDIWTSSFTAIDLYDGISGIALAFAYGAKIYGDTRYEQLARTCVTSIRSTLADKGAQCFACPGAFSGMGSLIYFFSALYQLWQESSFKDDIKTILKDLMPFIEQDQSFDIISGVAGCLMSLLAARNILSDIELKPYMDACVNKIIKEYRPQENSLLGLSHGASGIALALYKYDLLFPRAEIKKWIEQALHYERSNFSAQHQNWPDYRNISGTKKSFAIAWCHGAPGIGLVRYKMLEHYQDPQIAIELNTAISTTSKSGLMNVHIPCHGSLGNLELIFNAQGMSENFVQAFGAVINDIKHHGIRCDTSHTTKTPGLMTGTAGVIYQLLRFSYPNLIPSILLLEV